MPRYMITAFTSEINQVIKDSLPEMKKYIKELGFKIIKHPFGYYEIYNKNNVQIGLIDNYDKYCKTIYNMNRYK